MLGKSPVGSRDPAVGLLAPIFGQLTARPLRRGGAPGLLRITLSSDVLDLRLLQLSHLPRVQADPVKNPREIIPRASVIIRQRTEIGTIVGVPFVIAGMLRPAQGIERGLVSGNIPHHPGHRLLVRS